MRAVLDSNVLISALLSPRGTPARLLSAWREGAFEVISSPHLVDELIRALAYPKLRALIPEEQAAEFIVWFSRASTVLPDVSEDPPVRAEDPDDDFLISLAAATGAALVSGDQHLLSLSVDLPIFSPAEYLTLLEQEGRI